MSLKATVAPEVSDRSHRTIEAVQNLGDSNAKEREMGRRSAEYERYIRSTKWRKRRARFACTHPKICTCGSNESLQLHHRSYERLGNELDQDLMWLCQPCHSLFEEYIRAGLLSRGLDEIKQIGRASCRERV